MESNTTTIYSNTSTTNTGDINNKTKKNHSTKYESLSNKLEIQKINPKDISYDEYKNLTREDINNLYPEDTMQEQNNEAISLHIKANMTNDEVMNKVLFDKELESLDSINAKYLKPVNDIVNTVFEAWSSFAYSIMSLDAINKQIYNTYMGQKYGVDTSFQEYSRTMKVSIDNMTREVTYNRTSAYDKNKGISTSKVFTASEVFSTFDMIDIKYKMIINEHNYGKDSHFYQGTKAVLKYHEDIKYEYDKRVDENNTLLYSHTKSYSYTQVDYSTYYSQKLEDKKEK